MRRRNLILPEQMPWHVGTESVQRPTIFDSGNFPFGLREGAVGLRLERHRCIERGTDAARARPCGAGRAVGPRTVRGRAHRGRRHGFVHVVRSELARPGPRDGAGADRRSRARCRSNGSASATATPASSRSAAALREPHRGMAGNAVHSRGRREGKGHPRRRRKLEVAEEDLRLRTAASSCRSAGGQYCAWRHRPHADAGQSRTPGAAEATNIADNDGLAAPPICAGCRAARACSPCTWPMSRSTWRPAKSRSNAISSPAMSAAQSIR